MEMCTEKLHSKRCKSEAETLRGKCPSCQIQQHARNRFIHFVELKFNISATSVRNVINMQQQHDLELGISCCLFSTLVWQTCSVVHKQQMCTKIVRKITKSLMHKFDFFGDSS